MSITRHVPRLALALFAITTAGFVLASCSSDSSTAALPSLYTDSTATRDVATTSGDAVSTSLETMTADEAASLSFDVLRSVAAPAANVSVNRTKTCYDANGGLVAGCSPASSVRTIVTHVTMDGSRGSSSSVTGGAETAWSGALHRVSNDTTVRTFSTATPSVELSRTHSDVIVGHDTTMFTQGTTSRNHVESYHDTVKGVTWNLPRSSNPFPVSGSIVRVDSVHVTISKASQTETRDKVHVVEVNFPADAQGNVVIKVNDKTCSLNLVTHAVSNCK
ncbi:MAG: hypothetical protein M3Z05_21895 [Gemmatimonadota bacterium]|nr:hypothetical protein [Gemmatimonadota bacterium]